MGIFGPGKSERATEQLRDALNEMLKQHAEDALDYVMNPASFDGIHGDLVRAVNALVKSHIDVKMEVVDVATRYAEGDFSLDMARLPGKKATVTRAMDKVRDELRDELRIGSIAEWNDRTDDVAVEGEVGAIVYAAGEGDFTKRIAMAGKQGFFSDAGRGHQPIDGNQRLDRANDGVDCAKYGECEGHRWHGQQGCAGSDGRGRGGQGDGGRDEANRQENRHHRRYRLSDQPAGAECGDRGGARRRTRQGLRGRGG